MKVYEVLVDYGMPVMAEDITYAVRALPDSRLELMKLLVAKCKDAEGPAYEKAITTATKSKKKQFIAAIKDGTMKVDLITFVYNIMCTFITPWYTVSMSKKFVGLQVDT